MRVLVTGAAGYVGSILCPHLLNNAIEVVGLDNLTFGGDGLLPLFRDPYFNFFKADVRDRDAVHTAAKDCNAIIHLAAIVGYPACANLPHTADAVNITGTSVVSQVAREYDIPVIFASTQSVYGSVKDGFCDERSPTKPLSLYADTKLQGENELLAFNDAVILRFPTAFGLSPRMRLDLLVNDFTYKAITDSYIVVYQPDFMRAFIHVWDIANAYLFTLDHLHDMTGEVFNVGSDSLNFSKRTLCEAIAEQTSCYLHYMDFDQDKDKRDYTISFAKIAELGYSTTIDLEKGIWELVRGLSVLDTKGRYANA